LPVPGILPILLTKDGEIINDSNVEGLLCFNTPWPGMIRSIFNDHNRFKQAYFSTFPGYYFSGDGAKKDKDGLFRIIGRMDDVINVSGHRFGTAEIENAINTSDFVIESAVVGYPHPIKGQGIISFVVCSDLEKDNTIRKNKINEAVVEEIGKIAQPEIIIFVEDLPKTRSGKIMRRILRKIAEHEFESIGETSTLLNPSAVKHIIESFKKQTNF
jgi:acetyl-CoA synthetase